MILTVEKFCRISRIQENRLIVAGILSVCSVIYLFVICMAYYVTVPMWLFGINLLCLFINIPLIWWVLTFYVEQRKRIDKSSIQ